MRVFLSDLHLDEDNAHKTAAFIRTLRIESQRCREIYVLGDLTEVWIGDDDDAPFARLLAGVLADAARTCRVFLMHGNRDFLFGHRFAQETGTTLLGDQHVIETALGPMALCHGDALCTRDLAYMNLRATLRSAAWQTQFLAQPLDARRAFVHGLRSQSRAANSNKPSNIMDVTPDAVLDAVRATGANVVVHGHTHRPAIHTHELDGRCFQRVVLGDWQRCGWLLRLADADLSLECFSCHAA